jgi:hypothetical protein
VTLRNYSNTSVQTTLTTGIDDTATSLIVADATGYPVVPFAIVVDPDSVTSEEVMLVTAKAGPLFTVTRAYDGTTAKAHASGAAVIHAAIAADFVDRQVGGSDGAIQYNNAGAFGGMVITADELTRAVIAAAYATGTLTLAAQPTVGDTITLGSLTFTYTDAFPNAGEIPIGADLAEAQANTVSIVNQGIGATYADAGLVAFIANVSAVVAALVGTPGNGTVTTETFTSGSNFFGQATIAGGIDGTDTGHVQAQSMGLTGSSAAAPIVRIVAAPGTDEFAQPNIFEIVTADDDDLINIDAGGNFYVLRDLRLTDATRSATFRVGQDKHVFIRIADEDGSYQTWIAGTPNDQLIFELRPFANKTVRINTHAEHAVALTINTFGAVDDNTDLIQVSGGVNFDLVFRLMQLGAVVIAQHVAPDDDELAPGQMAQWFDPTPGAAQFMIKAKDSDGTVVSGAWPLT